MLWKQPTQQAEQWACEKCTVVNQPRTTNCVMCASPKAQVATLPEDASTVDCHFLTIVLKLTRRYPTIS